MSKKTENTLLLGPKPKKRNKKGHPSHPLLCLYSTLDEAMTPRFVNWLKETGAPITKHKALKNKAQPQDKKIRAHHKTCFTSADIVLTVANDVNIVPAVKLTQSSRQTLYCLFMYFWGLTFLGPACLQSSLSAGDSEATTFFRLGQIGVCYRLHNSILNQQWLCLIFILIHHTLVGKQSRLGNSMLEGQIRETWKCQCSRFPDVQQTSKTDWCNRKEALSPLFCPLTNPSCLYILGSALASWLRISTCI